MPTRTPTGQRASARTSRASTSLTATRTTGLGPTSRALSRGARVARGAEQREILVDGHAVNLIHAGQGDIEGSTIFHVPSVGAVVCGDVVYNNVHMMM